jgi:O-antigen/teichoic acid export membrane protein
MSKIKRLAGETVLYGLGSILPRFLSFLLIRLHTSVFQPEDYGVYTTLYAWVGVFNVILSFGMETAYFRFATKPGADERRIFNLTQTVVIGISLLLCTIFVLAANPITNLLGVHIKPQFIALLAVIMFIDAIVSIPFARLRLQKKALLFATGRLTNIILFIALNWYFLKMVGDLHYGIGLIILANVMANAFYVFFFLKTLIYWRPAYDKALSPTIISYAYPVMLTGLAGMLNESFSRQMLDAWLPDNFYPGESSTYALGVFGACYKFSVLMLLAIQAFRYAAEPFFFSNANEKNSPQLFARVNHYFILVCCILFLSVSINLDLLKYFIKNEAYWQGMHIVPILLMAYLFLGVYYNFSAWFKLTDKTYFGTIITLAGAVVTIAGNYFLIPVAGYEGSSWATLLCYLTMMVMCYLFGQRYYPVPYNIPRALLHIIAVVILTYFANTITFSSLLVATGFHAAVIVGYLFVIYLLEGKGLRKQV